MPRLEVQEGAYYGAPERFPVAVQFLYTTRTQ